MITVLECLENAEYNLSNNYSNKYMIDSGLSQLRAAIKALRSGKNIVEEIEGIRE